MRRATLGVLNGNQSGVSRDSKTSLGARPSTGSRLSSSGRPSINTKRRSSQYGRDSHHGQMKDPRNLSDRAVYRKNIRYLMEFLTEFNYPNPISERILSAPPMKEFKKIFLFIYSYINPSAKEKNIDKRPEEEIPRIFKLVGYPFTISKSSMFSVGSPHTWPNLLGALCWLIELTRFAMKTSEHIDSVLFDDEGYVDRLYFKYLEDSYLAFMNGKELDDLKEFQNTFFNQMRERNSAAYQEIEQLEGENTILEQELAELEGPSKLESLVQKQKSLEADREKFKKYIEDLKKHSKKMCDSNTQLGDEILALRMEMDTVSTENTELQDILDKQNLSPADVQRLKTEKKELSRLLKDLENNRDHLDKTIWALEMEYSRIHEETEKNIREYNETARKLKLVPAPAENAHGFDFEMHFNPQQPGTGEDFKDILKPELLNLKEKITEKVRNLQTQIITEEEALDQISDIINEKQEEIDSIESKQAVLDKEIEVKKEEMAKEYQQSVSDVQERETRLTTMKKQVQESGEKKQQQLQEMQHKADKRITVLTQEVDEFKQFLVKACHVIMEHKAVMSNSVKEIGESSRSAFEETKSLQVPQLD